VNLVDFPERLAELRRQRGLTQAALAERAGVHLSQLGRYESGANEPTLGVIAQLAAALSTTADFLVFGTEPRLPKDDRLRLAFEATDFLDENERDTVCALLDAFLARHEHQRGSEGPRGPRSGSA
jgi:transcriptional regulator with XRE-family HTH domain